MKDYKKLIVWQKSMTLAQMVFLQTGKFPEKEKFGLISQINRSAVSIASNIAEGSGRSTPKEYQYFLSISLGSAFELETQFLICRNIGYLKNDEANELLSLIYEIQKMLQSLLLKIKQNTKTNLT